MICFKIVFFIEFLSFKPNLKKKKTNLKKMGRLKPQSLRELVIEHSKNGKSNSETFSIIASKVSQRTISRWTKTFREKRNSENFTWPLKFGIESLEQNQSKEIG